jgi:putative addiction module component (TIGR02574 family)
MTETAERMAVQIKAQLLTLSSDDRAELAEFLLDYLDSEEGWDEETEKFWDLELDRRGKEIASGTAIGQPFEQVLQEIRAKYS